DSQERCCVNPQRPEAPPLSFHNVAARSNGCSVAAAVGAVAMESPYGSSGGVSCRGTSSGGTSSGVGSVVGGTGVLFSIALRLRPLGLLRATFFRAAVLRPAVMRVAVLRAAFWRHHARAAEPLEPAETLEFSAPRWYKTEGPNDGDQNVSTGAA